MSNVKELVSSTVEITPNISVDIVQYQPTGRPIEDSFSTTFDQASNRLILGVFDGISLSPFWPGRLIS
jgi:pyruvate dehydrogenase phosphatase